MSWTTNHQNKKERKNVNLMYRSLFVFDKIVCFPQAHWERNFDVPNMPRHICNLSLFLKLLLYTVLLISEQIYEMDVCILMCLQCKWLKDIFITHLKLNWPPDIKISLQLQVYLCSIFFNSSLIHIFSFLWWHI